MKLNRKPKIIGLTLILVSFVLAFVIFYPVIKEELGYAAFVKVNNKPQTVVVDKVDQEPTTMVVVDKDFSVVIPKINANTKVIANVDPNNSIEYQNALSKGVAHAKGSSLPNTGGNTFLFAHSSDNFINANRYNSVFYLLYKLDQGDLIYVAYLGKVYKYKVSSKTYVNPDQVEYLNSNYGINTLNLMTCWPPGTTNKRLIVSAKLVEPDVEQE